MIYIAIVGFFKQFWTNSQNMNHGKTIRLFLIDGDANGRISCELSNWSGKAYKIPRTKVKDCSDRDDLQSPGVYLLLGKNEEGIELVYIGEAESILSRLNSHLNSKDFWNEVIVILSKDGNLNKAHIKYLENRLHAIAFEVKRYKVENSVVPTKSSLSESDRSEMEVFIENIKVLVSTLGHKIFDSKREAHAETPTQVFGIKAQSGADAKGESVADGFLVLKGSKATSTTMASFSLPLQAKKSQLAGNGILRQIGDIFEFTEDYIFSSASTAAAIILGRSSNGLTEWKLPSGETLKSFEEDDSILK